MRLQKTRKIVSDRIKKAVSTLEERMEKLAEEKLSQLLRRDGIIVHDMDVNSLVTTMEMAGASISIMKMDNELLHYYDMPCSSPYYTKQ